MKNKIMYYYFFILFQCLFFSSIHASTTLEEDKIFNYNYSIYNTLPSVEEADVNLKLRRDFDSFLLESKEIACRYNLEEIMGVRLIHRHTFLNENQAMIEKKEEFENKPALITYRQNIENIEDAVPASWILKEDHFYVFEYSSDEKVKNGFNFLRTNQEFFNDYASLLVKYSYQSLVAPAILNREWYKNYIGETVFLEKSYSDRSNFFSVITVEDLSNSELSNSIQTAWMFIKNPISHGCQSVTVCYPEKKLPGGHTILQRHKST